MMPAQPDTTGQTQTNLATSAHAMELQRGFSARPGAALVVFDFDGTLSWLRHGWPELMFSVLRPHFPARPGESEQQIHDQLLHAILSSNGKPSAVQMEEFAARVKARGAEPPAPDELLSTYQGQLDDLIRQRTARILTGAASPDEFLVFGARQFLSEVAGRGLRLAILSGTWESRVREEAALLGIAGQFGEHIHGSRPGPVRFSKREALERILREQETSGDQLICIGDGPVEIECAKDLGGLAVAVASDEENNGSGRMDPVKRRILLAAGADAIVADYRGAATVARVMFGQ